MRCSSKGGGCIGLEGKCRNVCYCFGVSQLLFDMSHLFLFPFDIRKSTFFLLLKKAYSQSTILLFLYKKTLAPQSPPPKKSFDAPLKTLSTHTLDFQTLWDFSLSWEHGSIWNWKKVSATLKNQVSIPLYLLFF